MAAAQHPHGRMVTHFAGSGVGGALVAPRLPSDPELRGKRATYSATKMTQCPWPELHHLMADVLPKWRLRRDSTFGANGCDRNLMRTQKSPGQIGRG
jgi:hypothetical protein